jgi:hypothetical protein
MIYHHCFSMLLLNMPSGGSKDNLEGLKLDATHQLFPYADDVNIVGENTDTKQKNTEALLIASKEVGLEINPEKTKYMLMSRKQAGQKAHHRDKE